MRAFLISLLIALTIPLVAATHSDSEPNNSCASATSWGAVTSGSSTGFLSSTDLSDYSKVWIPSGKSLTVQMGGTGATTNYNLRLLSPSCAFLRSNSQGAGITETITYTTTSSGTYYFEVYYVSGPYTEYSISFNYI